MVDLIHWLGDLHNSKIVALLLFFITFCGILLYVFTGKRRKQRLESYKYIPFADEDETSKPADKAKVDEQ